MKRSSTLLIATCFLAACSAPSYKLSEGPKATLNITTDTNTQYVELDIFMEPDQCRDRRVISKMKFTQTSSTVEIPAGEELALMVHDVRGSPFPRDSADSILKFTPVVGEIYDLSVNEDSEISRVQLAASSGSVNHTFFQVSRPMGNAGPFCKGNLATASPGATPYTQKTDYTPYLPVTN